MFVIISLTNIKNNGLPCLTPSFESLEGEMSPLCLTTDITTDCIALNALVNLEYTFYDKSFANEGMVYFVKYIKICNIFHYR